MAIKSKARRPAHGQPFGLAQAQHGTIGVGPVLGPMPWQGGLARHGMARSKKNS